MSRGDSRPASYHYFSIDTLVSTPSSETRVFSPPSHDEIALERFMYYLRADGVKVGEGVDERKILSKSLVIPPLS